MNSKLKSCVNGKYGRDLDELFRARVVIRGSPCSQTPSPLALPPPDEQRAKAGLLSHDCPPTGGTPPLHCQACFPLSVQVLDSISRSISRSVRRIARERDPSGYRNCRSSVHYSVIVAFGGVSIARQCRAPTHKAGKGRGEGGREARDHRGKEEDSPSCRHLFREMNPFALHSRCYNFATTFLVCVRICVRVRARTHLFSLATLVRLYELEMGVAQSRPSYTCLRSAVK